MKHGNENIYRYYKFMLRLNEKQNKENSDFSQKIRKIQSETFQFISCIHSIINWSIDVCKDSVRKWREVAGLTDSLFYFLMRESCSMNVVDKMKTKKKTKKHDYDYDYFQLIYWKIQNKSIEWMIIRFSRRETLI